MRPLIGVFTSERHAGQLASLQRCDESAPATELRLGMPYLRAVELGGGIPVVVAPESAAAAGALLDRLDGLCLAGGPDLDPLEYGAAERHEKLGPTDRMVDAAELALVRGAEARGLPLLGICRGLQAMNVARGGTLCQHVDDHRQTAPATEARHAVDVVAGSLLAGVTGAGALEVNSFHHQAADVLGTGLTVSARAADGTVEALEDRSRPFLLGVQWHAEGMVERPAQLALFAALAEAAAAPRLALVA
ncbi:MAG: gamma-glutamyl-gamma-aminobutyrate hydrolase family protein [Solirubrobacteraceae bacterium]